MNNLMKAVKTVSLALLVISISSQVNAFSVVCLENNIIGGSFYDVAHIATVSPSEAANNGYVVVDATMYWNGQSAVIGPYVSDWLPDYSSTGYQHFAGVKLTELEWIWATEWSGRGVLTNYSGQVQWGTLLVCDPSAYYG